MNSKEAQRNEGIKPVKVSRPMLSQGVHLGFLVFGALVSLALFLSVQSFTHNVLNANYKDVSQEISEVIAQEFDELEFSLRTVSTLLSLSDEASEEKVVQKIANVEDSLGQFEAILWLHKVEGEWSLLPLYENLFQTKSIVYSDILKQVDIRRAVARGLSKRGQLNLVTQVQNLEGPLKTELGSSYFAIVKAAEIGDGRDGVIIALTNLEHVFETRALRIDELVSKIAIRDIANDSMLYKYKREKGLARKNYATQQSFDLRFGGQVLEISSQFFKQENMLLLEILPYLMLGFGMVLTATITFYLRSNHHQARKFFDINKRLSENNEALEQEIEKRELLNQSARRVDRENRAIIDSVSDIIFETDLDAKILFLNAQWSKITGFESEQSIGLELFNVLHPQDQHDIRDEFQSLVYGKIKSFRKFTRVRTSDGTFRAAELSISMINREDERAQRVVGTFTDVEERRRAERALSEAERKYRNIVQNAAGGIFQMTPEGLYLSANPAMADILGYDSPEQLLREVKNAHQDVYDDISVRKSFVRELEKSEIVTNHETQMRRRDGTLIWVNENIHTVRDEGGNVLYFEGSIEDIVERKESAISLQKAKMNSDLANRAKSEFLANMSHELRTPLNSIIGFSEMIKDEVFGAVEQREYWEYARDINNSGKNLLNVINEILDISKIEAGERHLNESQVKVDRVAASCIDLLRGKVESGDITITDNLAGIPEVIGEELSLKQVMMNLLSNAVKFTPKGGRISLSYEVDREGRLHLSVTDTGIGLDDDEIKKALSPFGQMDNDLDRSGSGTGLGLTLVDSLLKLHGAEFGLVSQKGIGTTATAIFPKGRVVAKKAPQTVSESETH